MPHAMQRVDLAGRDLTAYLAKLLRDLKYCNGQQVDLHTSSELCTVADIKEKLCYVSDNFEEDQKYTLPGPEFDSQKYKMPDSTTITLSSQMVQCPELMFKPALNGFEMSGLHVMTYETIMDCDLDVRKELFANIVLSGGTTMIRNLPGRLETELEKLTNNKVNVLADKDRMIACWLGGKVLSQLTTFSRMWMQFESNPDASPPTIGYDEMGDQLVHQMCNM